jgi:hypothetical protein
MELIFKADTHKYESVSDPDKKWISTTKMVSFFKEPFDKDAVAERSSKNKKSKWYGMDPEKIKSIWSAETNRAVTLGSWYHDQREKELLACDTLQRNGIDLPIVKPIEQDGVKHSPSQKLVPGVYPEHLVYLKSARICGQADRIEVVGDAVNVYDYKTNKEIKSEGYTNWEGITKMMLPPLNNIEDCNLMHYALQLSIYMYIILKHNHNLKPGIMEIHHVTFELEGEDENGYPLVKKDHEGNPIVKEVVPYKVPYLKKEVNAMIKHLKTHPELYD